LGEFEAHLKSGCAICAGEISTLSQAAGFLPALLPRMTAPAELMERILFAIRLSQVAKAHIEERTEQLMEEIPVPAVQKSRLPWLSISLTFAVVVLVAAFGLYLKSLLGTIDIQQQY